MENFNKKMPEGIKLNENGNLDFHYNKEESLNDLSEEEIEKLKTEDFTKYLELIDKEIERENKKYNEEAKLQEEIEKQKEEIDNSVFNEEDENKGGYKYKWQEIFNK